MFKFLLVMTALGMVHRDEHDDEKGGGGSGGDDKDKNKDDKSKGGGTVTLSQEQFDKLMAKLDGKGTGGDDKDKSKDDDLAAKAKKASDDKSKGEATSKALESALTFNIQAKEWLKTNASLLPKDVSGIFEAADKETYDGAVEKASAIKSGIIQTFFKVQENLDLLTASQKISLDEWLKLTKNGKEEKAQQVFDALFEPTFEMLKRIKKAELVGRDGQRSSDDAETAYKNKLHQASIKKYLGGK